MEKLIEILKKHNLRLASIESVSGGLFASKLTGYPNASKVYLGSIIAYDNIVKQDLLKIDKKIINKYGVVSEQVATMMAKNGSQILKSDVTVSFTGNAGPRVLENKDLGLIYTCIKIKNDYYNYCDQLSGKRNKIREDIVDMTKNRLIALLKEKDV